MTGLSCVTCVAAWERGEPTGAFDEIKPQVSDRPCSADVIYDGNSLCSRHFNLLRGHAAGFLRYPSPAVEMEP
jgi:hypothetical protein